MLTYHVFAIFWSQLGGNTLKRESCSFNTQISDSGFAISHLSALNATRAEPTLARLNWLSEATAAQSCTGCKGHKRHSTNWHVSQLCLSFFQLSHRFFVTISHALNLMVSWMGTGLPSQPCKIPCRSKTETSCDNFTVFPVQPVQGKALHCVYCHRLSSCFLKLDVGRVLMHSHCYAVVHTNPCVGSRYDRFKLIICTSRALDKWMLASGKRWLQPRAGRR